MNCADLNSEINFLTTSSFEINSSTSTVPSESLKNLFSSSVLEMEGEREGREEKGRREGEREERIIVIIYTILLNLLHLVHFKGGWTLVPTLSISTARSRLDSAITMLPFTSEQRSSGH